MWKVFEWTEKEIRDMEGYIIYPANSWILIGSYDTIDTAANIVKQEISLYNLTCKDGDPNPQFKIESCLE